MTFPIETKEQRLEIYKKALESNLADEKTDGLCIILRDLCGRTWYYPETTKHFPEFGKYYTNYCWPDFYKRELYNNDTEAWRKEVLNLCINDCEKAEETPKETPEEKAKRLGVPLIHEVKITPTKDKDNDKELREMLLCEMTRYQNEVISVCTCGKEITRKIDKTPCGSQGCPFGYETN